MLLLFNSWKGWELVYRHHVGVADVSNVIWGFANLAVGLILLWFFAPQGSAAGWILVALGVLLAAVWLSMHFGRVRLQHAGKFSDHRQRRSVLREGVLD
jgi:hypothetical protein